MRWLVEWMARELSLPIYYLDLRSKFLNGTALQEAITAGRLRHCPPVVFPSEEFQESTRTATCAKPKLADRQSFRQYV